MAFHSASAFVGCSCALAFASVGHAAPAPAATTASDDTGLSEITVTAEKYKSTIQNTPISLSALSGDQLAAAGISSIETLIHDVPGLSMRSAGPGLTEYEARGLASNGVAAPTVGFYLDEIPLSPPALSQSGKVVIDPNLYDVERVEVLRGPQGTLYGSGSMGGTVKILTNQPKLGTFEGSVQGNLSDTRGGGANYGGNLMLNLPLGDTLALRVVAGDTYRSGWINLVTLNPFPVSLSTSTFGNLAHAPVQNVIRNANDERLTTGRETLLFKPSEDLSITATAMQQHLGMGGYDLLDGTPTSASPGVVYDAHFEAFPLRESVHDDIDIYGLDVNANVGFADLTSATSYWDRLGWQTQDGSVSLYWSNHGSAPLVPVPYSEVDPSRQFSEELRLTSHDTGPLHWVAGVFYSSLHSVWQEESRSAAVEPVADLRHGHHDRLPPHGERRRLLYGAVVRRRLLLRLRAAFLQHRECAREPRPRQLVRESVRRQSHRQGRAHDREQHEFSVQYSSARALFDQSTAHLRHAGEL